MQEGQLIYEQGCILRAQRQYKEAYDCFEKASSLGLGRACWELGMVYYDGGLYKTKHVRLLEKYMEMGIKNGYLPCRVWWHRANSIVEQNDIANILDDIRKCYLSNLIFLIPALGRRLHHPGSISRPTGTDPWLYYFYANHACNESQDYILYCMEYAVKAGLACAQYEYQTLLGTGMLSKKGEHLWKEAALQLHQMACSTMCLNAAVFCLSPAEYVHYLQGDVTLVRELVGTKDGLPNDEDWWRESVVRAGKIPLIVWNEHTGLCKQMYETCSEACLKAVVTWILCSPFNSKDVTRYIGEILLRNPWWWWKE